MLLSEGAVGGNILASLIEGVGNATGDIRLVDPVPAEPLWVVIDERLYSFCLSVRDTCGLGMPDEQGDLLVVEVDHRSDVLDKALLREVVNPGVASRLQAAGVNLEDRSRRKRLVLLADGLVLDKPPIALVDPVTVRVRGDLFPQDRL